MRFGPDRRHESERGHALSLGAGERLAPAALKADWMAKRGENGPKRGQNGDFCGNMLRYYLVSDRPSRLFSAQQETVQRSPGWDWICTFVVADMRASGCSILSI